MNSKLLIYENLKDAIKKYMDEEEISLVYKAYMYAFEKHFGEKRLTGEDYINHPLNVAYILTEIEADCATICAALLHDILEKDENLSVEIEEKFGKEISDLVKSVTKINKLSFNGTGKSELLAHQKILVGLSEDVRVIIIKLADRLHNMRTLWVLPLETQKEKAKQTLDILTPIAHRLGISKIKSELEDLSLRYYKPDIYFSIIERLNQSKAERDNTVIEMVKNVSDLLNEHDINHEIKGRAKSIYSIYKKLDKGKKFSDIYDLLALRVYVNTKDECYQALGVIHSKYKPIPKRFKDYVAMPKTNMYQSLHTTVFGIGGYYFEIQIRTYEMDKIAEKGIAAHWSYKENGSSSKASMQSAMEQKLQFFRSLIELKNDEKSEEDIIKTVKEDIFKENVYTFTPNGDVIELPVGSTPIDFAYKVHSSVGNKMVGAIVNGSIVPLDYVLEDNDIVKINVNKNSTGPNREWLNIAKSSQAKNKIRSFFNKIDKVEYIKSGEDLLKEELRRRKIVFDNFYTDENINKIINELSCKDIEEVYMSIGCEKYTPGQVINIIYNKTKSKAEIILDNAQNNDSKVVSINKNDIIVRGIDDIKVNVASCCKPVPNDNIVGYITKGSGISIHRSDCPNINEEVERIIDVSWNETTNKKYPTNILVHAIEDRQVLLNIITKTSNYNMTVQSINALNINDGYMFDITVLVDNKEVLNRFISEISSLTDVLSVERIMK